MSRRWYSRLLIVIVFFMTVIMLYTMLESFSVNREEQQVMARVELLQSREIRIVCNRNPTKNEWVNIWIRWKIQFESWIEHWKKRIGNKRKRRWSDFLRENQLHKYRKMKLPLNYQNLHALGETILRRTRHSMFGFVPLYNPRNSFLSLLDSSIVRKSSLRWSSRWCLATGLRHSIQRLAMELDE